METAVTIIVILAIVSIPLTYHFRRQRRDKCAIRLWVDQQHFELVSLRGPVGFRTLLPGLGLLARIRPGLWLFELKLQGEWGKPFIASAETLFRGRLTVRRK